MDPGFEQSQQSREPHGLSDPVINEAFALYEAVLTHEQELPDSEVRRRLHVCIFAAQVAVESLTGQKWFVYMANRLDDKVGTNLREIGTQIWVAIGRIADASIQVRAKGLEGRDIVKALVEHDDARVRHQDHRHSS